MKPKQNNEKEQSASAVNAIVMPSELNTVELAYKTLMWMVYSGRFDDCKASEIRIKLNDIYGEEVMLKVKEKYCVA